MKDSLEYFAKEEKYKDIYQEWATECGISNPQDASNGKSFFANNKRMFIFGAGAIIIGYVGYKLYKYLQKKKQKQQEQEQTV